MVDITRCSEGLFLAAALILGVGGIGSAFAAGTSERAPIPVADRKQLFIDHRFIESCENVELTVNPPVKRPGAVIKSDKPWDAFRLIFFTVADDEGIYKMWYQAYDKDQWSGGGERGVPRMCYAVSKDGLTWEKPDLRIVAYEGSKDNNILIENIKNASVFIDPHAKSKERYKIIYTNLEGRKYGQLRVGTSADGIHWNLPAEDTAPYSPDSQQIAFWDARLDKYVVYLRAWTSSSGQLKYPFVEPIESTPPVIAPKTIRPRRTVVRLALDDIVAPWPDKKGLRARMKTVLAGDELDPPNFDIYTSATYQYPYAEDAYFMFPMVYQHFKVNETSVGNDGVNDGQFCASRDGIHWMRYNRETYLERGLPGEPDYGIASPSGCVIRRGDYLYQYCKGWPYTHGGFRRLTREQRMSKEHWGRGYIGVAVQRLDGFVSADAPLAGGWLLTPPIVFEGNKLQLNINVRGSGEARVEIQDEKGQAIEGYSLRECDRIMWNEVAHTVKWRGNSDVSSLAGRPVRLKIAVRSAKLYAFQFVRE